MSTRVLTNPSNDTSKLEQRQNEMECCDLGLSCDKCGYTRLQIFWDNGLMHNTHAFDAGALEKQFRSQDLALQRFTTRPNDPPKTLIVGEWLC